MNKRTQNTTTIFDDVFRTMLEKMPELVIPVINEVFGTSYEKDEKIRQNRNEHFTLNGKIITDSCLHIQDKMYHLECQSQDDYTMVIRMIEYDFAIALNDIKLQNGIYEMNFPRSCVIFLRKFNPEHLVMKINFQDDFTYTYQIPAIYVHDYTKDEIFEKQLFMFLPYYIMRYEEQYKIIEQNSDKLQYFLNEFASIQNKMETVFIQNEKSEYYRYMIELITEISDYMLRNSQNLKERLGDVMGGKVLELETDRIIAASTAKGLAEGRAEVKLEFITAFLKSGMSCEELASRLNLPIEEIKEIAESIQL